MRKCPASSSSLTSCCRVSSSSRPRLRRHLRRRMWPCGLVRSPDDCFGRRGGRSRWRDVIWAGCAIGNSTQREVGSRRPICSPSQRSGWCLGEARRQDGSEVPCRRYYARKVRWRAHSWSGDGMHCRKDLALVSQCGEWRC